MTSHVDQEANGGSAPMQSKLWGERAEDWAEVMEGPDGWGVPVYRHVAGLAGLREGAKVLDVGCGAGRFLHLAAEAGAEVSGLDATPGLLEIARNKLPGADLREGDMESLPFDDDTFDLVTGFNSFFIAADMANALREAGRVAKPGGAVAMSLFGRPDRCDSTAVFSVLGRLMPSPPPGSGPERKAPSPPALHDEGTAEAIAESAGLQPSEAGYFQFEERYPDLATVARGMGAAPPFRRAASFVGEEKVHDALLTALAPFEQDGAVVLREEIRFLVATAA